MSVMRSPTASRGLWRDVFIALLLLGAMATCVVALNYRTSDAWNAWGALVLFVTMVIAERLSVLVPRDARVSVATIPRIVAVLLLPP